MLSLIFYEVDIDILTNLSTKATAVYQAIEDKKGENTVALDLRGLSSVTDILIVCNGRSDRHVQALAENIQFEMKKLGVLALGVEGLKAGKWILLDYGDVIVHIFHEPVRAFYDLEGIWSDAPRLEFSHGVLACG